MFSPRFPCDSERIGNIMSLDIRLPQSGRLYLVLS